MEAAGIELRSRDAPTLEGDDLLVDLGEPPLGGPDAVLKVGQAICSRPGGMISAKKSIRSSFRRICHPSHGPPGTLGSVRPRRFPNETPCYSPCKRP